MLNMQKHDGDTVSIKAVYTKEANADAERQIMSNSYILDMAGVNTREQDKDFILAQYLLTQVGSEDKLTADCNRVAPRYKV